MSSFNNAPTLVAKTTVEEAMASRPATDVLLATLSVSQLVFIASSYGKAFWYSGPNC
jgi:hypothetical protein